ncbi:minor capsid protein [Microviridae sp.]|nr:minor capsid protein [Microviridae sp.]
MKILKIFLAPLRGAFPCFIFGVDDALIGGGLALIGGLGSSVINAETTGNVNRENQGFAREQNEMSRNFSREMSQFSAHQADINRQWQERLSGSAYQRQVKDMEAAGINPMLAIMKSGGASTPGGDSASGMSAPSQGSTSVANRVEDILSPAVTSAIGVKRLAQDVRESDQRILTGKAAALASQSAAAQSQAQALKTRAETPGVSRGSQHGDWAKVLGPTGEKISEAIGGTAKSITDFTESAKDNYFDKLQRRFDERNNNELKNKTGSWKERY